MSFKLVYLTWTLSYIRRNVSSLALPMALVQHKHRYSHFWKFHKIELRNSKVGFGWALKWIHTKPIANFKRSLSGLQTIEVMIFALSLTTVLNFVSQPYLKTTMSVSLLLAITVDVPQLPPLESPWNNSGLSLLKVHSGDSLVTVLSCS